MFADMAAMTRLFFLAVIFFSLHVGATDTLSYTPKILVVQPQHKVSAKLVADVISKYTYQKREINDAFSMDVWNQFFNQLDKGRSYFLAADIKRFDAQKTKLDDALLNGDPQAGFDIYNTWQERLFERFSFIHRLLKDTFDFSKDEYFQSNRENMPWFEDTLEQNAYWAQRLKYEALMLHISGKHGMEINQVLQKRYDNFRVNMLKSIDEDAFSAFMNAVTSTVDPHTDYFSPTAADDFKVKMSQSLEGIGATLQTEGDYTKIRELVKGGPADRSKKIEVGDRITAVAQGEDGEFVDVIGWRIDEVVKLIRGPKGTKVRLQLLKSGAAPGDKQQIVTIVRDKIKLEESSAKGYLKVVKDGKKKEKIGVITIPSFYLDFAAMQRGERDYKSTTRDVKRLIDSLSDIGMQGLIIDLRNDGGGSLQEAITLSGLFIASGPIVQVKNVNGGVEKNQDPDPSIYYNGPLVVLVNRTSASASEIFAAAMQDYHRAVIVGEQTFGKGTVQNFMDLNNMRRGNQDDQELGQVKITLAKFYRISGGSTQHQGVIPDVLFPTLYDTTEVGENALPFSLAYDIIARDRYTPSPEWESKIAIGITKGNEWKLKNPEYNYLLEDIAYYQKQREETLLPLSDKKMKELDEKRDNLQLERLNARRIAKGEKPLKKGYDKEKEDGEKYDFILETGVEILSTLKQ